jgi:hypothetical protein
LASSSVDLFFDGDVQAQAKRIFALRNTCEALFAASRGNQTMASLHNCGCDLSTHPA